MSRIRSHRGFTLLELMVAMVLLSMIALLLYNGLYTVVRTSRAVESRARSVEDVGAVHRLLRRELAQFQPVAIKDDSGKAVAAFSGDAQGMRWIAPMPVHRGGYGLYWLALVLLKGDSPPALSLEYLPFVARSSAMQRQTLPEGGKVPLMSDVERMEMQYLRAATLESPAQWLPHWNDASKSPAAVRITLHRGDDEKSLEWLFPLRVLYEEPTQSAFSSPEEGIE